MCFIFRLTIFQLANLITGFIITCFFNVYSRLPALRQQCGGAVQWLHAAHDVHRRRQPAVHRQDGHRVLPQRALIPRGSQQEGEGSTIFFPTISIFCWYFELFLHYILGWSVVCIYLKAINGLYFSGWTFMLHIIFLTHLSSIPLLDNVAEIFP